MYPNTDKSCNVAHKYCVMNVDLNRVSLYETKCIISLFVCNIESVVCMYFLLLLL